MELSFQAKTALDLQNYQDAFEKYKEAAKLEGEVADFYLDKEDLEPTRSIIIRSAAILNLKAGLIDEAQRFIFFGLMNLKDTNIKEQLRLLSRIYDVDMRELIKDGVKVIGNIYQNPELLNKE